MDAAVEEIVTDTPLRAGYLSWSRMSCADNCGKQYALRYEEHVPQEQSGAATAGIAMHETVEYGEKHWPVRGSDLYALFEVNLTAGIDKAGGDDALVWGAGGKENAAWWRARGPEMLDYWWALRLNDENNGVVVIAIEAEMKWHVAGILFTGRLDRLDRLPTGHHRILDYKTGRYMSQRYQQVLYAKGVEEVFGLPVTYARALNLRTMKNDDFAIEPYRDAADFLVTEHQSWVDAGNRRPQPGQLCGSCSVWFACKWGMAVVEQKLLHPDSDE